MRLCSQYFGQDSHLTCKRCGTKGIKTRGHIFNRPNVVPFYFSLLISTTCVCSFLKKNIDNKNHQTTTTSLTHYRDLDSQSVTSVSSLPSMANYYSLCLVGAMDRLWFHQIILFSETVSDQKTPETSKPNSVSLAYSSLLDEGVSSDISLLADEAILSDSSPSSPTVLKHILCMCVWLYFFLIFNFHFRLTLL